MKKLTTTLSALAIAAALVMNLTACSNDDNVIDTPKQPEVAKPGAVSTVRVTVGAGIGDGTTRAAVTQEGTTRTLTFTANDRIFVREGIYSSSPVKYLAGYLDMVGSPSADGKNATFSGNLGVYLDDGTPSSYDFGDADPLTVDATDAFLVPADAPTGFFIDNNYAFPYFNDAKMIAADVNSLMKSALIISGRYNSSTKHFSLSTNKPILNCTIGHLQNNTEYTVKLRYAENQSKYEADNVTEITYDAMTVTSDDNGMARFVISGLSERFRYNLYYALQLVPVAGGSTKTYILGQKDLGAKVYNVTREIYIPYQQAGSEDYITTTFGFNESTWSQQTCYGLLKFKYTLCTSPGVGISQAPISTITINDGDGNTYTVTDTRDNGYGGTLGFGTDFQFYVSILPVSGKTLTITYDPHNGQYTYVGTVSDVTLAGGAVLDLGTVELVKTTN